MKKIFTTAILSLLIIASAIDVSNVGFASSGSQRVSEKSVLLASPVANFTVSPTDVSAGWPTVFDASSSNGGNVSAIANYTWDFGDNNITLVKTSTVVHSFAATGNYTVLLLVVDIEGLNNSISKTIQVLPEIGWLQVQPSAQLIKSDEFSVNINILHISSEWKFFGAQFSLSYNSTLLQFVNVTEGSFLPAFHWTPSSPYTFQYAQRINSSTERIIMLLLGEGAEPPSYIYPNGQGTLAKIWFKTTSNVQMQTPYSISFGITDVMFGNYTAQEIPNYGATGTSYRIRIDPPVPEFTYIPINQQLDQAITFNASASYVTTPYNGSITNYVWDFGDGSKGTGEIATHTYTNPGTFNVTLSVTDSNNNTRSMSRQISFSTWYLTVDVDAGTLYFKGEIAHFYILTKNLGAPVNVDKITAKIYYGDHSENLSTPTQVANGLYMITYTIPSNAGVGTWPVLVTAQYESVVGVGEKSFEISSTLTQWDAQLIGIEGNVSIIKTDIGLIQVNLTSLNAHLISVNGTVAKIQTDLGVVQADVRSINATVTAINGNVATITSDVGTIQTRLPTDTGIIAALLYVAIVFSLISAIGVILLYFGYRKKNS